MPHATDALSTRLRAGNGHQGASGHQPSLGLRLAGDRHMREPLKGAWPHAKAAKYAKLIM